MPFKNKYVGSDKVRNNLRVRWLNKSTPCFRNADLFEMQFSFPLPDFGASPRDEMGIRYTKEICNGKGEHEFYVPIESLHWP